MNAQKWSFKKEEYDPIEIPEGACSFSINMGKQIQCANCGKELLFGDSYTSRTIHTDMGMGYAVCGKCYAKEWEEEGSVR